jgi:hypothetical protein
MIEWMRCFINAMEMHVEHFGSKMYVLNARKAAQSHNLNLAQITITQP